MRTIDAIETGATFPGSNGAASHSRRVTLLSIAEWVEALLERRRSRLALLELTDDQLKDIGLSRSEAHREACRPAWD